MSYQREREIALVAVSKAAELCGYVRHDMVGRESLEKDDRSPVTVADFGAQAIVCHMLRQAFPDDPIVGEEDSSDLQQPDNAAQLEKVQSYVSRFYPEVTGAEVCAWIDAGNGDVADRYWTLDPIDGTKGFLRNDQYAVALALFEDGELKLGVMACPALPWHLDAPDGSTGVLFVAERGQGAKMAPLGGGHFEPIHVAEAGDTARIRFAESVEAAHGDQALQNKIARAVGITTPPLRMDSQAKYGAVARGDASLYLRLPSPKYPGYREKIWDHAAGTIIVEEAGGRVTDMFGRPLDFATAARMQDNRGVVVSNGLRHDAVIAALQDAPSS